MQEYHGTEKRMYQREYVSGTVKFKAYLGSSDFHKSHYKDYFQGSKYIDGNGELIDKSYGGIQIKTSIPLEKGYILEVHTPEEQGAALVRWVTRTDDYYFAGLMYT